MAKYDWGAIEIAYKKGIDIDLISKKYGVVRKTLQNRIYSKKWEVNTPDMGNINHDIEALGHSLGKLNGHTQNDPILESIVIAKIETQSEDNGLITNNRKLLRGFQGLMGKGMKDGIYDTAQDIKAGVSSLKDIESIANPQSNQKIEVNATQNNVVMEIE